MPRGSDREDFSQVVMKMWVMCRLDSECGPGERATADRPVSRSGIVSTQRTTDQVDQMPHTKLFGDFPQLDPAGRKDAAQQTLAPEIAHRVAPALGSNAQPLEDPGQFRRDSSRRSTCR